MKQLKYSYRDKEYMSFDLLGIGVCHSDSDYILEFHHIEQILTIYENVEIATNLKRIDQSQYIVDLRRIFEQVDGTVNLSDPLYNFWLLEHHMIKDKIFTSTDCLECETVYVPSQIEYVEFVQLKIMAYSEWGILRCPNDHIIFSTLLSHTVS